VAVSSTRSMWGQSDRSGGIGNISGRGGDGWIRHEEKHFRWEAPQAWGVHKEGGGKKKGRGMVTRRGRGRPVEREAAILIT